ncbi:MAG: PQQ-like beta-propeller repeat protein [Solirubrobacterales bacterium]|nr:PQQ-like beta-propeller repeat protein [Solirubrobacterales bacterium]
MKKFSSIWRAMTGAERVVLIAASVALFSTLVFAAVGLLKRPDDISNPDAAFDANRGPGKTSKTGLARADRVEWTRYGYDAGRSKFLDAQSVRPPFRKVWKYSGDELIEFPPIVVDDRVFFIDNDGLYVALNATTGRVVWKKRLATLNASSPAYDNGVLYSVSLEPGQALAVRASDGKVLWRKRLENRAESSPMVVRGRLYFGDEGGQLYALRTKDGSTIWQTGLGGSVKAAPALDGGTLFVGDYGGDMNAVRSSDGKVEWQTADLGVGLGRHGRIYSTAAVAFGRVYAGDVDGRVYSYDEDNGDIAWTFSVGGYVYSGVAAADTGSTRPAVYFGSHDHYAYAVDAQSGEQIWKASAGGQVSGPATVIGDIVYMSTFSGNATVGLDLGTGRRVFAYDDGEYGPVVSDGHTVYLTGGSTVTAFDPVDLGGYDYRTKRGQKGIVPPAERRRAEAAMRDGANPNAGGKPGGHVPNAGAERRRERTKRGGAAKPRTGGAKKVRRRGRSKPGGG